MLDEVEPDTSEYSRVKATLIVAQQSPAPLPLSRQRRAVLPGYEGFKFGYPVVFGLLNGELGVLRKEWSRRKLNGQGFPQVYIIIEMYEWLALEPVGKYLPRVPERRVVMPEILEVKTHVIKGNLNSVDEQIPSGGVRNEYGSISVLTCKAMGKDKRDKIMTKGWPAAPPCGEQRVAPVRPHGFNVGRHSKVEPIPSEFALLGAGRGGNGPDSRHLVLASSSRA